MKKKIEILHAINILSFFIIVAYIYVWRYLWLMHVMLALELIVFVFALRYMLRLRNYGQDEERGLYFKKSRWYMLFSLFLIAVYVFILYRVGGIKPMGLI
jgi:hypothetical protein